MIMDKNFLSLKDFELSMREDALTRAELFQNYIHQMEQFDSKSYWVMSHGCVGAKMSLTETNTLFDSYISNDYIGMSQCKETIEAGINALMKYGTGACAAQPIGGYLDIHRQLEKKLLTLSVKKMQFFSLLDLEQMPAYFVRYLARMILPILILIFILAR